MHEAIEKFIQTLALSFQQGHLLKCTLSKPPKGSDQLPKNLYLRPVALKKGLMLAFNYRYTNRDEVKNLSLEEAQNTLVSLLGHHFFQADLLTASRDYSLQIHPSSGRVILSERASAGRQQPNTAHDREKKRLLDPTAPWLHALGITTAQGVVHAHAQDKWRQINKYLEVIQSLIAEAGLPDDAVIADMGSGKGYLTFALYDYLRHQLGLHPSITGIELRQPLVDVCNETARHAGFDGLHFVAQDIRTFAPQRLDMLIALHACDTATDLALAAGLVNQAKILVVAPCCHKQVRKSMETKNELKPVLRFGILEERQAEILTDGIRALRLEAEGYQTKVFEFISTEHTAKNVMITAIKSRASASKRKQALEQIAAIKQGFGIPEHYLETLLT